MKTVLERDMWASEAAEIVGKDQPMVHRERVSFNFGVYMGIEILKLQFRTKMIKWREELIKRETKDHSYATEIRMINMIIDHHEDLGEHKVPVK